MLYPCITIAFLQVDAKRTRDWALTTRVAVWVIALLNVGGSNGALHAGYLQLLFMQASTSQLSSLAQRYSPLHCVLKYGQLRMAAILQLDPRPLNPLRKYSMAIHVLQVGQWQDLESLMGGERAGCAPKYRRLRPTNYGISLVANITSPFSHIARCALMKASQN